ncbi:MAG: P-loop NTPase [Solirubrobacterales bacterium]
MSSGNGAASGTGLFSDGAAEAPLEARRYLSAISRNRWLILMIVGITTGVVLFLSLTLPKTYQATATVVLNADTGVLGPPDPVTVQRQLVTADALIASVGVLEAAAKSLPGETPDAIENAIESSVNEDANLITITASDDDPDDAAAVANAVATSFLAAQKGLERERFAAAKASLTQQLNDLRDEPTASPDEISALSDRVSALSIEEASAGAELQLAERASAPGSPSSPRPSRNTILALFGSLFLGVLVALGREQLRPGVSEPRELSRLFGQPVLASIPYVRRRGFGRRRHVGDSVERELYQTLASTVQLMLPPKQGEIVIVTSTVSGEGKSTVTARLGQALAQAGHRVLLISADLRWPTLQETFGIPLEPGLADILALIERAGASEHLVPATARGITVSDRSSGREATLDVIASGGRGPEPAHLLSEGNLRKLFDHVRGLGYDYVLVDSPPILGVAEAQPLVRLADRIFFVARPDRLSLEKVIEAEELLGRLEAKTLGLIVIGGRTDVSLYYGAQRPSLTTTPGGAQAQTRPGAY